MPEKEASLQSLLSGSWVGAPSSAAPQAKRAEDWSAFLQTDGVNPNYLRSLPDESLAPYAKQLLSQLNLQTSLEGSRLQSFFSGEIRSLEQRVLETIEKQRVLVQSLRDDESRRRVELLKATAIQESDSEYDRYRRDLLRGYHQFKTATRDYHTGLRLVEEQRIQEEWRQNYAGLEAEWSARAAESQRALAESLASADEALSDLKSQVEANERRKASIVDAIGFTSAVIDLCSSLREQRPVPRSASENELISTLLPPDLFASGIATYDTLQQQLDVYEKLSFEGGLVSQLMGRLYSRLYVHPSSETLQSQQSSDVPAVFHRLRKDLRAKDMAHALKTFSELPERVQREMSSWHERAQGRLAAESAMSVLQSYIVLRQKLE